MSIRLAGQPTLIDFADQIEKWIGPRLRSFVWPQLYKHDRLLWSPFIPDDHDGERFDLPYGDIPAPTINEYINPMGLARYGRGMFLVGQSTMAAIATAAYGYGGDLSAQPATWGTLNSSTIPLTISYGGVTFTQNVFPLEPICLDRVNLTKLWMVPVVDARYKWLAESIRIPELPGRSWQQLIDLFAGQLGLTITPPAIDVRWRVPDPRAFAERYISPSVALDAILLSLGFRCHVNSDNTVTVQDATTALNRLNAIYAEQDVSKGGPSPEVQVPDKIRVNGPKAVNYVDCESWTEDATVAGGDPNADPFTVYAAHYEHQLPSSRTTQSITSRDALVAIIGETFESWVGRPGIVVAPGSRNWHDSTAFDYVSISVSGSASVYTTAVTTTPDFYPRVNFTQWPDNYVHRPAGSGWIFLSPSGGVPARAMANPGTANANFYEYDGSFSLIQSVSDSGFPNDAIPVHNLSEDLIAESMYFPADTVDKTPTATTGKPGTTEKEPWIRFHTNAKIVNRVVTAVVDIAKGDIINGATGNPFQAGDTVTLNDPNNLFSDIEPNATGIAYYRTASTRWEIEEVSYPINKVRAKLEDCLLKTDATFSGFVGDDPVDFILSDYPNVDLPPEFVDQGSGKYRIDFENPCGLDALKNTYVTLERQTNLARSEPANLTVPLARSSTTTKWVVTKIEKQKARHVRLSKNASTWNVVSFYEGENPDPVANPTQACTPVTATCVIPCGCLDDGDEVLAFYDPNTDDYIVYSSESALLGPPDDIPVINSPGFSGCSMSYASQTIKAFACGSTPTVGSSNQDTNTVRITSGIGVDGSSLCPTYVDVQVCGASPVPQSSGNCIDICDVICSCPQFYMSEECQLPPCNCGDCRIENITDLTVKYLDGETIAMVPGTSMAGGGAGSCSWTVTMDDGSTFIVDYLGAMQWEVTGTSTSGKTFSGIGDGTCVGAVDILNGNVSGGTADTSSDGGDCDVCEDCEHCPDDQLTIDILNWMGGDTVGGENIFEGYALAPVPNQRSTGNCEWQVDIEWAGENQTTGEIFENVLQSASVSYDGTTWTITTGGSPWTPNSGNFSIDGPCNIADSCSCDPPTDPGACADCPDGDKMDAAGLTVSITPCPPVGAAVNTGSLDSLIPDPELGPIEIPQVSFKTAATPAPAKFRLGTRFRQLHRDLFEGCACSDDIVPTLNRHGLDISDKILQLVSKTLANKHPGRTPEEIEGLIRKVIADAS